MTKLSELSLETEIVSSFDWSEITVKDFIEEIKNNTEYGQKLRKRDWYIAELEDMEKCNVDQFVDLVIEDMDENSECRAEKHDGDHRLEELRRDFQMVYDKFREKLGDDRKIYSMKNPVEIDL